MTNVPTTARSAPLARDLSADVTGIDAAARGPLLLLLGSGIVWLVISGVLALITSLQLHSPHFLSQYSFLTYGRTAAMQESAFVYGWAANAGLGIALWVLGRLGGNALRGANWVFAGCAFWNVGVTVALVGIAVGDMTSFSLFELPRYVQPFLVVAYGCVAISGVLAWMGRRTDTTYAAQWYAVAALFLFPWLSSGAQIVLLWSPLRGVAQSIGGAWYAQGAWSLWLAPLALASAYYLVPKLSGRVLSAYEFASVGFWMLIFIGTWTAGRHFIGGPVPAWVVTVGIAAGLVLLIHYVIVALNLGGIFGTRGTAASFIRFGFVAYLLAGVFETITGFRTVAVETQFTFFDVALQQLSLYGAISMLFFGAIYYIVPRLTGNAWASTGFTVGHRVLVSVGVVVLVVTLAVAGWTQGSDLLNAKVAFADVIDHVRLTLLISSGAQFVLLVANVLLLVNFLRTISATVVADVTALNPIQPATEASAP